MHINETLEILRCWQKAEGLSDGAAAVRLGFQQRSYTNWMQGRNEPKGFNRQRLERKARELKAKMAGGSDDWGRDR